MLSVVSSIGPPLLRRLAVATAVVRASSFTRVAYIYGLAGLGGKSRVRERDERFWTQAPYRGNACQWNRSRTMLAHDLTTGRRSILATRLLHRWHSPLK